MPDTQDGKTVLQITRRESPQDIQEDHITVFLRELDMLKKAHTFAK